MSRLNSLITPAAIQAVSTLLASEDGRALYEHGVKRARRASKGNEDVATVAGIIFAAWKGVDADGNFAARKGSVEAGVHGALRRCWAAVADDRVDAGTPVDVDVLEALSDENASADWVRGALRTATDTVALTTRRTLLADTLALAMADGAELPAVMAIAQPGRQAMADGLPTVRRVVLWAGLPTGGKRAQAAREVAGTMLANTLDALREAGEAVLHAQAVGVRGQAVSMENAALASALVEGPGAERRITGNVVWQAWKTNGPIFGVNTLRSERDVPVSIGRVCNAFGFVPEQAGEPVSVIRAVKGSQAAGSKIGHGVVGAPDAARVSTVKPLAKDQGLDHVPSHIGDVAPAIPAGALRTLADGTPVYAAR